MRRELGQDARIIIPFACRLRLLVLWIDYRAVGLEPFGSLPYDTMMTSTPALRRRLLRGFLRHSSSPSSWES